MTKDWQDELKTGAALEAFRESASADGEDSFIGRTIGEYRVERALAEGGMGRVYLATRIDGSFEGWLSDPALT